MTASKDQFEVSGHDVIATGGTLEEAQRAWAKKSKLSPHVDGLVITKNGKSIDFALDEAHRAVAENTTHKD